MFRRFFFFTFVAGLFFLQSLSAQAFSLSPTKQTVSVDPGQQHTVRVSIQNTDTETIIIEPLIDSFSVDSDTGLPVFGVESRAKEWVTALSQKATLLPGEERVFTYAIAVPEQATPGAYYLGLFAQTVSDGESIQAQTRLGSLLFLYVAGDVQESLVRDDFSAQQGIFFQTNPSVFLQLANTGNIHVIPQGEIVATNIFGKEVWRASFNDQQIKVFPDEKMRRDIDIEKLPLTAIGPIHVSAHIQYGITQQTFSTGTSFWIVPPVVTVIILFLIGAVLLFFIQRKKRV